jgi:cysteine desulfurase
LVNETKFVSTGNVQMSIYLDMAATTPTDPRVASLVLHLMTEAFGNAGSRTHQFGADALSVATRARGQVAKLAGAEPSEVIFTSGATEANNLAILGLAPHGQATGKRHIVSTAIEHKAVLEPLEQLEARGFDVTLVAPDALGHIDAHAVAAAVRPDTLLVSVMHANNETGAIQPVGVIADLLGEDGPFLHVDAAQSAGKLALGDTRIDLMSISGHKLFAPKGVGALIARRRRGLSLPLTPLMFGGGQERGLRPGTLPVPLAAGFGLACELALKEAQARTAACLSTREAALAALAPLNPVLHGDPARGVLPHILSIAVPGVDSEAIMVTAKDLVAISNGSACTSSSYAPSHVLLAMGLAPDHVAATIRISWSHLSAEIPWEEFARRIDDLRF